MATSTPLLELKPSKAFQLEIYRAYGRAGGLAWLTQQFHDNPVAAMSLLAKILPKNVDLDLNVNVGPIRRIELVAVNAETPRIPAEDALHATITSLLDE